MPGWNNYARKYLFFPPAVGSILKLYFLLPLILLNSCQGISFSKNTSLNLNSIPNEKIYYRFNKKIDKSYYEQIRQSWLRLAPPRWQKLVRGMQIDLEGKNNNIVFYGEQQWLLLLSDINNRNNLQIESNLVLLLGRLQALKSEQMRMIYNYTPTDNRELQEFYLAQDTQQVPLGSFLLFQPQLGRSIVPAPESLIAKYAQKFWRRQRVIEYQDSTNLSQNWFELLNHNAFTNALDEFSACWMYLIYQPPNTLPSIQAKLDFLQQDQQLNAMIKGIRQRVLYR